MSLKIHLELELRMYSLLHIFIIVPADDLNFENWPSTFDSENFRVKLGGGIAFWKREQVGG